MKGIVLAGGKGTRLRPVTKVLNKNLLPVYDKPMICYGIEIMRKAQIRDVAIVAEPHYIKDFWKVLRRGYRFDVRLEYISDTYIKKGPAQAVYHARDFIAGDDAVVLMADNIIDFPINKSIEGFGGGATVFVKKVQDASSFGVVEIGEGGKVLSIEEKPSRPKSDLALIGLTIYDNSVFKRIENVKPGVRGEYYLTDVNKMYLEDGQLLAIEIDGFWIDAGTSFDNLLTASNYWAKKLYESSSKDG